MWIKRIKYIVSITINKYDIKACRDVLKNEYINPQKIIDKVFVKYIVIIVLNDKNQDMNYFIKYNLKLYL